MAGIPHPSAIRTTGGSPPLYGGVSFESFTNENMRPKLISSAYEGRKITSEDKAMKSKRANYAKRRQVDDAPSFPFKDDHGVTVTENRRKVPDRRATQTPS